MTTNLFVLTNNINYEASEALLYLDDVCIGKVGCTITCRKLRFCCEGQVRHETKGIRELDIVERCVYCRCLSQYAFHNI